MKQRIDEASGRGDDAVCLVASLILAIVMLAVFVVCSW